jgi:hypothetical protein
MNFWSCRCRACSTEILLLKIEPARYTMSELKPKFSRGRKVIRCRRCGLQAEYRRYEIREIQLGCEGASELVALMDKRYQTNQLQR